MAMQKMGRPVITTRRKSKNQIIAEIKINKANKELEEETNRQLNIVWHALAIALYRYHGWTNEKINTLVTNISAALWEECAGYGFVSMIEMLWDECGIELMNEDKSKRWFEIEYLNSDLANCRDMELNEWLTMRRNQKSWVGPQVTACALLSLYRMEGWTDKAMGNLYKEFETIKQDFNYDPDNLKKASLEETGFQFVDEYFMVPRRISDD